VEHEKIASWIVRRKVVESKCVHDEIVHVNDPRTADKENSITAVERQNLPAQCEAWLALHME